MAVVLAVGVPVPVWLAVQLGEGVELSVGVGEGVAVAVELGDPVAVGVGAPLGEPLCVGVCVATGVPAMSAAFCGAMATPRYTEPAGASASTVAAAAAPRAAVSNAYSTPGVHAYTTKPPLPPRGIPPVME